MRSINLPRILEHLRALHNLHVHVDGRSNLNEELRGDYPMKLRNLTITGKSLRTLATHILQVGKSYAHAENWHTTHKSIKCNFFFFF